MFQNNALTLLLQHGHVLSKKGMVVIRKNKMMREIDKSHKKQGDRGITIITMREIDKSHKNKKIGGY